MSDTAILERSVPRSDSPASAPQKRGRLPFIDSIRGLAVALMALDHVRSFFHSKAVIFEPTDLTQTTAPIFFTRWVTHLCAPLFVLLAGMGAAFSMQRRGDPGEMAAFLRARGLWLIVIEFTLVKFGWTFNFSYAAFTAQVIWAIGWSMILLSLVVRFSPETVMKAGIAGLVVYALCLEVPARLLGPLRPVWETVVSNGSFSLGHFMKVSVKYPILPWASLMAVGFGLGPIYRRPRAERRRALAWSGAVVSALFLSVRWLETGGWHAWSAEGPSSWDFLWLLDAEKYPPSLSFFLMTVGPSLLLLAACDRESWGEGGVLSTFGRVPFFFYISHLPLIHGLAAVAERAAQPGRLILPMEDWKYPLTAVYLVWIAVLAMLYPACFWFADLKKRRRDPWLSFL